MLHTQGRRGRAQFSYVSRITLITARPSRGRRRDVIVIVIIVILASGVRGGLCHFLKQNNICIHFGYPAKRSYDRRYERATAHTITWNMTTPQKFFQKKKCICIQTLHIQIARKSLFLFLFAIRNAHCAGPPCAMYLRASHYITAGRRDVIVIVIRLIRGPTRRCEM